MRKFIISEERLIELLLTEDEFIAIDDSCPHTRDFSRELGHA